MSQDSPACIIGKALDYFDENPERRWTTGRMQAPWEGGMCLVGALRYQRFHDPNYESDVTDKRYKDALVCVVAAIRGVVVEVYADHSIDELEGICISFNDEGSYQRRQGRSKEFYEGHIKPALAKAKELCA